MIRKIHVILVFGLFFIFATGLLNTGGEESSKIVRSQNNMVKVIGSLGPRLSYYPKSNDFGDMYEGEGDSTTFEIWNSGCCELTYSLNENCSWTNVLPKSGYSTGEHDTIKVNIDVTGLQPGPHSCKIMILSNGGKGQFTVAVNVLEKPNNPPNTPIITGPLNGRAGKEYKYTVSGEDTDGDEVSVIIDWDDGTNTGWLGPFEGSYNFTVTHTWDERGNYTIRAQARDQYNAQSGWGYLEVTMPKHRLLDVWFSGLLERCPWLNNILKR